MKLFLLLLLLPSIVFSQSNNKDIEIQLVTVSPGAYYWEAFGHSAIRLKTSNYDHIYGFGYFNFEDEDFFINFAKGEMQYYLGVDYADRELYRYKFQGRKVTLQTLNFSETQKQSIINELSSLNNDEDRFYQYDYFENNCTSRIRDIINLHSDNQLFDQLNQVETAKSLFDATFPVVNQAWVNLAFTIAYGLPAYEVKNQWQLSVFPQRFSNDISEQKKSNQWVKSTQVWYQPNDFERQQLQLDLFKTHYAVFVVILVLVLGLSFKFSQGFFINTWLVMQSLLGFSLLFLWFFSFHQIAALNINVLLFIPLAFLLCFSRFKNSYLTHSFLGLNLLWLILALWLTSYYLIGFVIVNLLIWNRLRQSL